MPPSPDWKEKAVTRFWNYVKRTENIEDCWLWHRQPPNNGYPIVSFRTYWPKPTPAHRVAFRLHYGYEPSEGRHICHKCNNRICCNPHHLYDGTAKTNHEDAVRAGTFKPLKTRYGEQVPNSKLRLETVLLIRRVYPLLKRREKSEMAKLCGVTGAHLRRLVRGEGWHHHCTT